MPFLVDPQVIICLVEAQVQTTMVVWVMSLSVGLGLIFGLTSLMGDIGVDK
jgi:hypothetical protein